ncbi:MAG: VOC family protein [Chloroflexi bacterium]|nr:VOC family protein [Chloroflexota bacterium]MCL5275093.1 VOC family protein [Chloroflexota bacterium]
MSRITHFEIHASQPQPLIDFYTAVLGWSFTKWDMGEYWLIQTGPSEQPGINGGLLQRPSGGPSETQAVNAFVCTADVASLDETLSKAMALGASIALAKDHVPGVGWLAYIKDPDGNVIGLIQREGTGM